MKTAGEDMSEVTDQDLEKLNTVYWDIAKRGKAWEEHAKALSDIYYACEAMINNADVIESSEAIEGKADLVEEDTTGHRPPVSFQTARTLSKAHYREKVRLREAT